MIVHITINLLVLSSALLNWWPLPCDEMKSIMTMCRHNMGRRLLLDFCDCTYMCWINPLCSNQWHTQICPYECSIKRIQCWRYQINGNQLKLCGTIYKYEMDTGIIITIKIHYSSISTKLHKFCYCSLHWISEIAGMPESSILTF